jgi:hypothetical protein
VLPEKVRSYTNTFQRVRTEHRRHGFPGPVHGHQLSHGHLPLFRDRSGVRRIAPECAQRSPRSGGIPGPGSAPGPVSGKGRRESENLFGAAF